MSDRPSKIKTYMDVCDVVKLRSHDAETKVGAILVKNSSGAIIASGCNGFVRGADDSKLPNTRPEKYKFIIHAEANLIANCANLGIAMNDCTLVCTLSPCVSCMRWLFQCGITKVIVKDLYKDFSDLITMKDIIVAVSKDENNFYELNYTT